MRTFVAIEIEEAILQRLQEIGHRGWIRGGGVRWMKPENIHLTLKFLGEIAPEQAPGVTCAMENASQGIGAFPLEIRGLGFFPNPRRPRVFWAAAVSPGGELDALQKNLETELHRRGFQREQRPFRPHLTLARFKGPADCRMKGNGWNEESFGTQRVEAVVLFRSELQPQGAVYTTLHATHLKE